MGFSLRAAAVSDSAGPRHASLVKTNKTPGTGSGNKSDGGGGVDGGGTGWEVGAGDGQPRPCPRSPRPLVFVYNRAS
jgi:hypothetical protein